MKKEFDDDKLRSFLRFHKPDVPSASSDFEEQLLNATLRVSWRYRLKSILRFKWRYAFSASFAAVLIFVSLYRNRDPLSRDSAPLLKITQTAAPEVSDADVYSFFAESWNGVETTTNVDFLSELDSI